MKYVPIIIIILSLVFAIYFYPQLPDTIASHWGFYGEVNGYSSKTFGLFFLPGLLTTLYFLFLLLPKIDPYKNNFRQFQNYYQHFINIVFAFLFYIYCLTLIWNLGFHFNMIQFMSPALATIFYYAGVLNQKAKRNWFVGIRTPWTLSSDQVWSKTHFVGGKLFKATAIISLFGAFWPSLAMYFLMIPLSFTITFVYIYSYYIYRQERK